MGPRKVISMTAVGLLVLGMAQAAFAQGASTGLETAASAKAAVESKADVDLPDVSVVPGSFWYGFKLAAEVVADIFVTGNAQADRDITVAKTRLAEALEVAAEGKVDLAAEAAAKARARLEAALARVEEVPEKAEADVRAKLLVRLQTAFNAHAAVLERLFGDVEAVDAGSDASAEGEANMSVQAKAQLETVANSLQALRARIESVRADVLANTPAADVEATTKLDLESVPLLHVSGSSETEVDESSESTEEDSSEPVEGNAEVNADVGVEHSDDKSAGSENENEAATEAEGNAGIHIGY